MPNLDENISKREIKETKENDRKIVVPEELSNSLYTPGFLREQIGKLLKVEFLIGENNLITKIGILEDVGITYILLRSLEGESLIYADITSIKFITILGNIFGPMNYVSQQGFSNQFNNRYY